MTCPPLTTVDIPAKTVAETGLNLLIDLIEKKTSARPDFQEIETELIERQSG